MTDKKPAAKYRTIMLVDDSEVDNFINRKLIENCNLAERIYTHSSGKSALEFFKSISMSGKLMKEMIPDLIFLDINMPIMDGFAFMNEFNRMGEEITSHCKVIIVTSSVNPSDQETAKRMRSVVRFANKPLSPEVLMKF